MTRARQVTEASVSLVADGNGPAAELSRVLNARGIHASVASSLADAIDAEAAATAFAPQCAPTPQVAAELVIACGRAAQARAPVIMLTAFEPAPATEALERAASLAYLSAHGAVLCPDPDAWLETIVLIASYGLPSGPRVAVVAPPGSWLALSATALAAERASIGARAAPLFGDANSVGPTDTALVDRSEVTAATPTHVAGAQVVPVIGRAESLVLGAEVCLVGLRAAIAAASAAGKAAHRINAGLGPTPRTGALPFASDAGEDSDEDGDRVRRQLDALEDRAGDHETKIMLKAWGVRITRQAVATTPSAATRIAKRAGWPVEVKPWSADAPSELDGCPVHTNVLNAPEVRRAAEAVIKAAGLPPGDPVIVRETPPPGRELRARIARVGALGWTAILDIAGAPGPIAAPAPLRAIDARELAQYVEASRTTDPEPDREALVELLVRVSSLVASYDDAFDTLDLCRIIVAAKGQGAVVVDARATLRSTRML